MREHIEAYLEFHKTAWAQSTLKSEQARLRRLFNHMETPEALHTYLVEQGKAPYTIKTTFVRVCDMERWASLPRKFQEYMDRHGNRFKHVYSKEKVEVTYEEAIKRINQLEGRYRIMALGLLSTGARLSEAYTASGGVVVGKGGKTRKLYGKIEETAPRSTFWRKLKAVGLKPHTLRKLCATRLAENGATPADLCEVLGWTDIKTSYQYLQPREDSRLEALMAACKKGT